MRERPFQRVATGDTGAERVDVRPQNRPVVYQPLPVSDGKEPATPGGPAPMNSGPGPYGSPVVSDPLLSTDIHPGQGTPHVNAPDVNTTTLSTTSGSDIMTTTASDFLVEALVHDHDAEQRQLDVSRGMVATASMWPVISQAATPADLDNRIKAYADRIEAAVPDPEIRAEVLASLRENWEGVQAQAAAARTEAARIQLEAALAIEVDGAPPARFVHVHGTKVSFVSEGRVANEVETSSDDERDVWGKRVLRYAKTNGVPLYVEGSLHPTCLPRVQAGTAFLDAQSGEWTAMPHTADALMGEHVHLSNEMFIRGRSDGIRGRQPDKEHDWHEAYQAGHRAGTAESPRYADGRTAKYTPIDGPQPTYPSAQVPQTDPASIGPDGFSIDYAAANGEGAGTVPTINGAITPQPQQGPAWVDGPVMPQSQQFGYTGEGQRTASRHAAASIPAAWQQGKAPTNWVHQNADGSPGRSVSHQEMASGVANWMANTDSQAPGAEGVQFDHPDDPRTITILRNGEAQHWHADGGGYRKQSWASRTAGYGDGGPGIQPNSTCSWEGRTVPSHSWIHDEQNPVGQRAACPGCGEVVTSQPSKDESGRGLGGGELEFRHEPGLHFRLSSAGDGRGEGVAGGNGYPNPSTFDGTPHGLQGPNQFPADPTGGPDANTPLHLFYDDSNSPPPVSKGSAEGTVPNAHEVGSTTATLRRSTAAQLMAEIASPGSGFVAVDHYNGFTTVARIEGWTNPTPDGVSYAITTLANGPQAGEVHKFHPDGLTSYRSGSRLPFARSASGGEVNPASPQHGSLDDLLDDPRYTREDATPFRDTSNLSELGQREYEQHQTHYEAPAWERHAGLQSTALTNGRIVGICDSCGTALRWHDGDKGGGAGELHHLHNDHNKCNGPRGGKSATAGKVARFAELLNGPVMGTPAYDELRLLQSGVRTEARLVARLRVEGASLERPDSSNNGGRGSDPYQARNWDAATRQRPMQSLDDVGANTPTEAGAPPPTLDTDRRPPGSEDDDDERRTASRKEAAVDVIDVACGQCAAGGVATTARLSLSTIATKGLPKCPKHGASLDFADEVLKTANSGGTGWNKPMPDPLDNYAGYQGPNAHTNPFRPSDANMPITCPTCNGTGTDLRDSQVQCPACRGTGTLGQTNAPGRGGAPLDATTHQILPGGASSTASRTASARWYWDQTQRTAGMERRLYAEHPSGYRAEFRGGARFHVYEGDTPVASPTLPGYSDAMSSSEVHDLGAKFQQHHLEHGLHEWAEENGAEHMDFNHPGGESSYGQRHGYTGARRTAGRPAADPYLTAEYQNTHGGYANNGAGGYRSKADTINEATGLPEASTPMRTKTRPDHDYAHGNAAFQMDEASCPSCGHAPTQLVRDAKDDAWWHCPNCGPLANIDKNPDVNPYSPTADFQPNRSMKRGAARRLFSRIAGNQDDSELFALLDMVLRNNPGMRPAMAVTAARQGLRLRRG